MNDWDKVQKCFETMKTRFPNAIGNLQYLETPAGWNRLLLQCAKEMEKTISQLPKSKHHLFGAAQIKEKFGGLRWYTDNWHDSFEEIIKKYETLSYRTCEVCGKDAKTKNEKGWVVTVCKDHENHEDREQNQMDDNDDDDFFIKE